MWPVPHRGAGHFLAPGRRTVAQTWCGDREVSARRGPARGGRVEGDASALAVPATNDGPGDCGDGEGDGDGRGGAGAGLPAARVPVLAQSRMMGIGIVDSSGRPLAGSAVGWLGGSAAGWLGGSSACSSVAAAVG